MTNFLSAVSLPDADTFFQHFALDIFNPQVSSKGFWHATLGPYFELIGFRSLLTVLHSLKQEDVSETGTLTKISSCTEPKFVGEF